MRPVTQKQQTDDQNISCGESFKDLRDLCKGNRVLIEVKIFQDWTLYVSTVFDVLSRFC